MKSLKVKRAYLWAENFASEERKQSKNHCSPVKLKSKKQEKNNPSGEGLGWEAPIDRLERASSHVVLDYNT